MNDFENYLNGVLSQVIESHGILSHLKDKPGDLEIISKELGRLNGLLHVVSKKIENQNDNSDKFVNLQNAIRFYLDNYSFEREIETMSKLYSEDSNRLRNIRSTILDALNEKKMMEKIQSIRDQT